MTAFQITGSQHNPLAHDFFEKVVSGAQPLFLMGRNVYSEKIIKKYKVSGVIDDYFMEAYWNDVPVLKLDDVPSSGLVLVCTGGRTLTALKAVKSKGLDSLDYFSFYKVANEPLLQDVVFNENFIKEFKANEKEYIKIFNLLEDEESKNVFLKLVSFRLNYDISVLEGFTTRLKEQYFEDFLKLEQAGEVFADVGCFDGFTTLEFIRRCPNYKKVFAFEPEPRNFAGCIKSFEGLKNIELMPFGLGSKKETLHFSPDGSASAITSDGELNIDIQRLDDITGSQLITFLKMDIEGGESSALQGASNTIAKSQPRIAISVYHKPGDFWRIPEQILSYNKDYKIYMRHYTETIYETVMFFIPK